MKQNVNLLRSIYLCLIFFLACYSISAQNSDYEALFSLTSASNNWPTANYGEYNECYGEFGSSKWITYGYKASNNCLLTGFPGFDNTALLYSESPLNVSVDKVEICMSRTSNENAFINYFDNATLEVSDKSDFSDSHSFKFAEFDRENGAYKITSVELPQTYSNCYFRLNITTLKGSRDTGWLCLDYIKFYKKVEVPTVPNAEYVTDHVEVVTYDGDLHLLLYEYDIFDNLIREIESPDISVQTLSSGRDGVNRVVVAEDDTTWRHKVGDAGVVYILPELSTSGHHFLLRAKTVSGSSQSPEYCVKVNPSILTDVIELVSSEDTESDSFVEWFSINGQKIDNPTNGVYIRKIGSKVDKVVL